MHHTMQRVPPIDAVFHVIMAGYVMCTLPCTLCDVGLRDWAMLRIRPYRRFIGGFAGANTMGNHMWEQRNHGKLFHHMQAMDDKTRATFKFKSLETKKEQNPRTGVVGLKKGAKATESTDAPVPSTPATADAERTRAEESK